MRRELIFDSGISQPDNQFHAVSLVKARTVAISFPFFCRRPWPQARLPLPSPSVILLALLDNFRLGRSRAFSSHSFRSRHNFFLHRGDVDHGLALVGNELDLVALRQIGNTNHFAEDQFTDIGFDRRWECLPASTRFRLRAESAPECRPAASRRQLRP